MDLKEQELESKRLKVEASLFASWSCGRMNVRTDHYELAKKLLDYLEEVEAKYLLLKLEADSQSS